MSDVAVATSSVPSACNSAVAFVVCMEASQAPMAKPQPTSSCPSRLDRGAGVRLNQPNRSAPIWIAARSSLLPNGLFLFPSFSA